MNTLKNTLILLTMTTLTVALSSSVALATLPYVPVTPGTPGIGPGVAPPSIVPGKEYSHDFDTNTVGAGGAADPEQVIAWDGSGGTTDGLDFTGTRGTASDDEEIDAIANHGDFLFKGLLKEDAHLVFSVDDVYTLYVGGTPFVGTVPPAGPVALSNGNIIGGAGELSVELGTIGGNPVDFQAVWAKQLDVNGMPLPRDVDGVELWGPEPAITADTDKYSLDTDTSTAPPTGGPPISVWNGVGTPYITHATIVAAVTSLLDPPPTHIPEDAINLDALMVRDVNGSTDVFDRDAAGLDSDAIIFSIRQIPDGAGGYYATGSELFVLDAAGSASFLVHGGHVWDKLNALTSFDLWPNDPENFGVLDINAIEAVGQDVVPEPATVLLLVTGLIALMGSRRRSGQ